MRIHGIHLQGLKAPMGRHRFPLDPGYNLLVLSDLRQGASLRSLLSALLHPATHIDELEAWGDPGAGEPARAGVSLSFGAISYRIIADLEKRRLVLGCYDSERRRYARVSTDPAEIQACLRGHGLPAAEEYGILGRLDVWPPAPSPASAEPRPGPRPGGSAPSRGEALRAERLCEIEDAERAQRERAQVEASLEELRGRRDRLALLGKYRVRLREELAQRAVLEHDVDGLDERILRLQEAEATAGQERAAIEDSRWDLTGEREALARVPGRQRLPLGIGIALAALGTALGSSGYPLFYIFGPLGGVVAAGALFVSGIARRRVRATDTCLAALRARERAAERALEHAAHPVTRLLSALELEGIAELERVAADYRGLRSRALEVEQEIGDLDRNGSGDLEEKLGELEQRQLSLAGAPDPAELRRALELLALRGADSGLSRAAPVLASSTPSAEAGGGCPPALDPDEGVRAAALVLGLPHEPLRQRVVEIAAEYLSGLTEGARTRCQYRAATGWWLSGPADGEGVAFAELEPEQGFWSGIAIRLAAIQVAGEQASAPLLVGPAPLHSRAAALAAALARLAARVQVLQLSVGSGAWAASAQRTLLLASGGGD